MKILLIEDDEVLADVLAQSLTSQHYVVDTASDGQAGWDYAQSTNYDLILMDVGLPQLNGISLCQKLRSEGYATPILLMTAKEENRERIRGLDAGADDYLIKPLDLGELQARVRALLRRGEVLPTSVLQVGDLRLDPNSCQISYSEQLIKLTPKEYSLLELFLRNPSRVFSRGQIVDYLWTFDDPPLEESVKAHVKGLRQKLKQAGAEGWIENIYGLGYRLNPKESSPASKIGLTNPVPNPTANVMEQEFTGAVDKMWQHYQGLMAERVAVLQIAAAAVQTGTLSEELRQSARWEAHKLAGVLGMFDRQEGTLLAREIEQMLVKEKGFPVPDKLVSLVQTLNELLALSPPASLSTHEVQPLGDRNLNLSKPLQHVLVVDDDPIVLAALRPVLEPWGMKMTGLDDPQRFWDVLPSVAPDLLVLDVEMPQVSGIQLCQAVRNDPYWQRLPILFLTAHRESETIQQVFAAGADDYVTKPIVGPELLTRITNRLERTRLLQSFSTKDPQTGLANQPQSSRDLEQLLSDAQKYDSTVCLALLTVSQLRQINIEYGHIAGNQVLQQWGRLLRSAFDGIEVLGYWGSGEFIVGMPGISKAEREEYLSTLLMKLRQQIFTAPDGKRFQVPCRWAIAQYPADGLTIQSLYQSACTLLDREVR